VDMTYLPAGFGADDMVATPMSLSLTNTAGVSLTSVSFTLTVNASGVTFSYGAGNTKATVGTITNGATGSGGWTLVGPFGPYSITFAITYKKGVTTYNTQYVAPLNIVESGSGKRSEIVAEVDLAEVEAVATRSDDDDDDDNNNINTGNVLIVPSSVTIYAAEASWVSIGIKNQVGAKIKEVSFVVNPQNSLVSINYRGVCAPANGLGNINNNQWGNTSYQIGGPAGSYSLKIQAKYKIGTHYYSKLVNVQLTINAGSPARSSVVAFAHNEDGSMKTEYIVGFGVGIACFAGLAVVGAAIMYRKRNAATTIA